MTASETFTVGEMAARIARSGAADEVAAITRQLRNWTNLRLLEPLEELHSGTGRHRRYGAMELFKAAILEVLARNFKIDVTGLKRFVDAFDGWRNVRRVAGPRLDLGEIREGEMGHELLQVTCQDDGVARVELGTEPWMDGELAYLVDLTAIARRVFP